MEGGGCGSDVEGGGEVECGAGVGGGDCGVGWEGGDVEGDVGGRGFFLQLLLIHMLGWSSKHS